ncbi:MAG: PEGA domain-containing protein [Myxococcales bacterium]|nr:PEGA domain-containing protein [Myxococcales bacterium]
MMRRSMAAAASLGALLILTLFAPAPASAQSVIKVAVLGIETVNAPAIHASNLATALKTRVQQTPGYKLVPGKALDEIKLVFGCVGEKPECMAKVGRTLAADKLLWGKLAKARGGFKVTVHYLDVKSATMVKTVEQKARSAELKSADELAANLTKSFLVASQGTIKLDCAVNGAQVLLGAKVKGTCDGTPLLLTGVPAGTHIVQVRKDNYRTWVKRVNVAAGATVAMQVRLEVIKGQPDVTPPPPTGEAKKPSRTGWKVAFWTSAAITVGLGVGIAVAGVSVFSIEDEKKAEITNVIGKGGLDATTLKDLQEGNACDAATRASLGPLSDICSRGKTRATIVNALIGAVAVTGILSGYFLYRAYIKADEVPSTDGDGSSTSSRRPPVRVQGGFGPDGVQLGVSVDF